MLVDRYILSGAAFDVGAAFAADEVGGVWMQVRVDSESRDDVGLVSCSSC